MIAAAGMTSTKKPGARSEQKNFQPSDFNKSLALVRSERLQATSVKLQAPSVTVDKKELLCYRRIKEKEL